MPNVGKKENENYFMLSIPIFTANGGLYKRVPNLKDFVLNGYKCFAALRLTDWLHHKTDIGGFTYCIKIVRTTKVTHVADYSVNFRGNISVVTYWWRQTHTYYFVTNDFGLIIFNRKKKNEFYFFRHFFRFEDGYSFAVFSKIEKLRSSSKIKPKS
jgi:hypothetical protein